MKAEKQYKEATSRVIQPLKGGGGYVVQIRFYYPNKIIRYNKWIKEREKSSSTNGSCSS